MLSLKTLCRYGAPAVLAVLVSLTFGPPVASAASTCPTETKAAVLCAVNAERAAAGLRPVAPDPKLDASSQAMAELMLGQLFFAHVTPDGRDLVDRARAAGYLAPRSGNWVVGENLAWGSGALSTPEAIVAAWMNSPSHRANILAADYRDIGIGIASGSPTSEHTGGVTYVTDFGARSKAPAVTAKRRVSQRHKRLARAKRTRAALNALRAT